MLAFAFGELGLLPDQFYRMTWWEYATYADGYTKRQSREWERTRLVAWMIFNANAKKPLKKPEDLMQLVTDERKPGMDREEQIAAMNKHKEFIEKLNNGGNSEVTDSVRGKG